MFYPMQSLSPYDRWPPTSRRSPFFSFPREPLFRSFADFDAKNLVFPNRLQREFESRPKQRELLEFPLSKSFYPDPLVDLRNVEPTRYAYPPEAKRQPPVLPHPRATAEPVYSALPHESIPVALPRPAPSASIEPAPTPPSPPSDPEDEPSPQESLDERLSLYGLKEKTAIKGDGNCQFSALADQLYNDPSAHAKVRKMVVNWLRENRNYTLPNGTRIIDYLQTERFPEWKDFGDYMEQDKVWGDHFTLIAASELFQIKIVVVSSIEVEPGIDPFTVIIPKQWMKDRVIFLSHLHELHYSSLIPDDS